MKTVLITSATALTIALTAAASVSAGIPNPAPTTIDFPTDFDGFMGDKAKKTATKSVLTKSE
ncbi:hypothetical protein [uncultured Tateyamaria sp.]|uniref:hypothetical protein n=1 Tax=Tateyamaria sp. 1078 TaxID=3417464 RepID=UPI00260800FD|nr:hypothetical protein [uncultured Tateyamaria sp.]